MSKHEIDIMWQKAMKQSIEDGEIFTRYHFAKLVAERALADSMREVQRLGQEIEQEPVAWFSPSGNLYKTRFHATANGEQVVTPLYTAPPQRTEQEPVAWRNAAIRVGEDLSSVGPDGYYDMTAQQWLDWAMEQNPRGEHSLPQRTEHLIGCVNHDCDKCKEENT